MASHGKRDCAYCGKAFALNDPHDTRQFCPPVKGKRVCRDAYWSAWTQLAKRHYKTCPRARKEQQERGEI